VRTSILENLQGVCKILNEEGVEYLAIGGAAVALHGHERWSTTPSGEEASVPDLDFWYNPTYDNYFRVLNALEKLGENVNSFRAEKTPDPRRSFFRLERPLYTLDLLPSVPGLPRFREAFAAKETTKLGDFDIPVIGYAHLIQNKQALGRPKDQEDIRQLELKKQGEKARRRPRQRPH
jgi:hypothetical protein